jgi:predicted Zn-dependent peptidase
LSEVNITRLDSGLTVVSEAMPGAHSVSTGVWVKVGARDEPAGLAGASHFLEHLLFKGTAERSARNIAESVDRVGGEMNAYTTKEYTAYYTRLPAGFTELSLELLGDVLTRPALRDNDVEAERHVILEELLMDDDTPDDKVHSLLFGALFPDHPLGRETAGEAATVAALTVDEIRSFFAHWYHPAAMVVAAAGAVDHDELVAGAERCFVAGDGAPATLPERTAPGERVEPLAVLKRPTEQTHLAIGYRGLSREDPSREALDVVNHVLGGGMSSRLFDEIREKRGLAYSVYSAPSSYADAGALSVYAGTTPDHVTEVLDLVDDELDRIASDGITGNELDVAIGYLAGSYVLALEDTASRMARVGGQICVRGAVRDVDEQVERYRNVTLDDVAAVADRVLTGPRALAAVGPVAKRLFQSRRS